jgi:hypothetical protein
MQKSMKEKYIEHIENLKANAQPILQFIAPCCLGTIATADGVDGEEWNTLAACPHCGSLYTKVVRKGYANGYWPPRGISDERN